VARKVAKSAASAKGKASDVDVYAAMQALSDQASHQFGDFGVDKIWGISLEGNIPLQYLFGVDVIPLGRMLTLAGAEGSLKSLMGWYFMNLFAMRGGIPFFSDVEKKTNYDQVRGIFKNDMLYERINKRFPSTVSELSKAMAEAAEKYDEICPKREVPICYMIDSIGALTSEAAMTALDATGDAGNVAGFDGARRAFALTEFLRNFLPAKGDGRPFFVILINHLKVKLNENGGGGGFGPPAKTSLGGAHKDYMNTYTLELIKVGTQEVKSEKRAKIIMKTLKSALSPTGLKIEVMARTKGPINERYPEHDTVDTAVETEDDVQRLYVDFDWDLSLVELLTREKGSTFEKAALSDVLTITGSGNSMSCKRLGLSSVSKGELGAAIHADAQVCKELQNVLGIFRKRHF